jgi:hypothetical protein
MEHFLIPLLHWRFSMKEGDLVRMDGQTGVIVLAWGVMDVVEVLWDDGETRGQNTCELELLNEAG